MTDRIDTLLDETRSFTPAAAFRRALEASKGILVSRESFP